jgi:hypothetical protein
VFYEYFGRQDLLFAVQDGFNRGLKARQPGERAAPGMRQRGPAAIRRIVGK